MSNIVPLKNISTKYPNTTVYWQSLSLSNFLLEITSPNGSGSDEIAYSVDMIIIRAEN